jgi:hypothetical protein
MTSKPEVGRFRGRKSRLTILELAMGASGPTTWASFSILVIREARGCSWTEHPITEPATYVAHFIRCFAESDSTGCCRHYHFAPRRKKQATDKAKAGREGVYTRVAAGATLPSWFEGSAGGYSQEVVIMMKLIVVLASVTVLC